MTLPAWVVRLVRGLAPAEFADDLLDDLDEGFARRRREGRPARRWLALELARTPWMGMRTQARRMRAAGTRREMPAVPGGDVGRIATGLRIAGRSLLRRPAFTLVAVTTLAASIGAATLSFSVIEGVLLRPLPYEGGERVYRVYASNEAWREADQEILRQSWDQLDLTEDMVEALRGAVPGAEALGAYTRATVRIDDGLDPAQLSGARVLPGFFEALPLAPVLGRLPSEAELRGREPVVVLSERLWASRYGRDPEILGRSISLAREPHTVIGVLPASFAIPSELARWWTPVPESFADGRTDAAVFSGLVRLSHDTAPSRATEGVDRVARSLAEENPTYAGMRVRLQRLDEIVVGDVREGITMVFWSVVVVVLIASVNLANLMVARGARRRAELAMRSALGASRGELVWAMLSETVIVCAVGGGLGVLAATQLIEPFIGLLTRASPGFPRGGEIGVNAVVLLFSVSVAVLTVVVSGLLPALAASRRSPWEALQHGRRTGGGRATRRTQRALLVVEAALAMLLLTVAGLLTRSALYVSAIDPGYDSQSVAYLDIETSQGRYADSEAADALGQALEARLGRIPGTVGVAYASALPGLGGANGRLMWSRDATQAEAELVWASSVSPGYFEAMGIALVAGRSFVESDPPDDPPIAVVSERFADRFLADVDPIGQTVMMGVDTRLEGGSVVSEGQQEVTVVGVVEDVRQLALIMEADAGIYLPMSQSSGSDLYMVLRTSRPPRDVLEAARAEAHAEDPGLLITESDVLRASMRRLLAPLEVRWVLILTVAGLAAFLTVVGVYGVVAYVVSDQVHEIGLRMALGARSGGESTRMVRQALGPVAIGSLLGLVGAYAASGLVESGLVGVEPLDPATYLAVVVLLLAVTAVAALVPARRAATVDPMRVLTEE